MTRELRLAREGELGDKTVTYTQKELDKLQAYLALHEKEYFGMVGAYWEQAMFDGHHRLASEVASPPLLPILVEEGEKDECTDPDLPISVVAMDQRPTRHRQGAVGTPPPGGVDVTSVSSSPPPIELNAPAHPKRRASRGSAALRLFSQPLSSAGHHWPHRTTRRPYQQLSPRLCQRQSRVRCNAHYTL